jgi:hypothetical protein
MNQLLLWSMEEMDTGPIEVEESVNQEVIAIMAEAVLAVVQARKEEGDEYEHVEES